MVCVLLRRLLKVELMASWKTYAAFIFLGEADYGIAA